MMSKQARRWYDADPILLEVINLMSMAPTEAKQYASKLIAGVEKQVPAEVLASVYEQMENPDRPKNRWYDTDETLVKAVELLKLLPHEAQRAAAMQFIEALKDTQQTTYAILMETFAPKINTLVLDEELEEDEAAR